MNCSFVFKLFCRLNQYRSCLFQSLYVTQCFQTTRTYAKYQENFLSFVSNAIYLNMFACGILEPNVCWDALIVSHSTGQICKEVILFVSVLRDLSNTRKRVSSDFQTPRTGLKSRGAAEFLKPTSRCLEIG